MANFAITISNYVNTFGGITNKWNAFNWGAFLWGQGTADLPVDVMHVISEAIAPDSAINQKDLEFFLQETLSTTSDMSSEGLTDGSGYNYVFTSNTTEGEDRDFVSYTSGTAQGTAYSSLTTGSTVWS
jgi:hypothetical protein